MGGPSNYLGGPNYERRLGWARRWPCSRAYSVGHKWKGTARPGQTTMPSMTSTSPASVEDAQAFVGDARVELHDIVQPYYRGITILALMSGRAHAHGRTGSNNSRWTFCFWQVLEAEIERYLCRGRIRPNRPHWRPYSRPQHPLPSTTDP